MNKTDMREEIIRRTGSDPLKCMKCGKCSASCPSYDEMEYHPHQFADMIAKPDAVFFLAYADETAVGFAQCQLRQDYVEGTESSLVGYLEGVFVEESHRNSGHARSLLAACEQWAREQGCSEFASDCELTNTQSLAFHLHCGFREANRIICFTKKL